MPKERNRYSKDSILRAVKECNNTSDSFEYISKKYGIGIGCLKHHFYKFKKNKQMMIEKPKEIVPEIKTQNAGSRSGSKGKVIPFDIYKIMNKETGKISSPNIYA